MNVPSNQALFDYIAACPTPYHAVAHTGALLREAGFTPLSEGECWRLEPGKRYFTTRNGSSLLAFSLPEEREFSGFLMAAAHCDTPCFKLKEDPELPGPLYTQLSTEKYGGMLCASWMDRPLSVAGRLIVREEGGVRVRLVDLGAPVALIPNVAIHMNRKANDGMAYNAAVDMLPLSGLSGEGEPLLSRAAQAAGVAPEAVVGHDLFLYNPQSGVQWGDFLSAPRLDDLQCAFAVLEGFLSRKEGRSVPVFCLFDNEEVGSETKQGAASTFLFDTLRRICDSYGLDHSGYCQKIARSFLVSCDNAHAVHPNHPEYADKTHGPVPNGGVVVKYNANQRYATDGLSSALFSLVCEEAGAPVQRYANRSDLPGGSTLGSIADTKVSLRTVDVGLAQLAMHSAFETAGAKDGAALSKALSLFFGKSLVLRPDGLDLV